ncbi:hypothetical protein C8R47DRAFT_1229460 [Mycena vitilis]|nr:hypothetical protein C8R47DRAFT_1229460 [Mycena vitilis]
MSIPGMPLSNEALNRLIDAVGIFLDGEAGAKQHPLSCPCGQAACYRCYSRCDGPELCGACMVHAHQIAPFHDIREWSDFARGYVRASLSDLGLRVELGHGGSPCPSPRAEQLEAITTRGLVTITVHFCNCPNGATAAEQIKQQGWQLMRSNFVLAVPIEVIWTLLVPDGESDSESAIEGDDVDAEGSAESATE